MTVTELPVDRLDVLEAKLDLLGDRLAVLTADAEHRRRQRESLADLTADVNRISPELLAKVTDVLAEAERKGYFAFAGAAARVADRVVTGFDDDAVDQLGDNVVTILETVREITQPELLALLGRMVDAVRAEQAAVELEDDEAPTLWALARQARDPDVRRGMARALHTLRAVSVNTTPTHREGENT